MKKLLSTVLLGCLLVGSFTGVAKATTENDNISEASITFKGGNLSLIEVNDLIFGTQEIDPDGVYKAENYQEAIVGDYRGKKNGEWSLSAEISSFTDEEGKQTLPGFELIFDGDETKSKNGKSIKAGATNNPVLSSDASKDGVGENGAQRFVGFSQGQGRGTWTSTWNDVKLSIPDGAETVGTHEATITWTLTDAVN